MGVKRYVVEPGGTLAANQELATLLQSWLERGGRKASGAIVIGLYGEGFELQYLGAEQLDARGLEDYVLRIAGQIIEARPR